MGRESEIDKLRGNDNYHTWSMAVQSVLVMKGLKKCLSDNVEGEFTTEEDEKCKAQLTLSVDTRIYVHIQKCSTAKDVWQKLKDLYEDQGLTRKISLLRSLISMRLDGCSGMQDYVDGIKVTANKLIGIGFEITDEWIGAILLAGLTDEFGPLIMSIEAAERTLSSDKIISKLMDSQAGEKLKGEAFFGGKKNSQKKDKQKKRKCFVCGSTSHLKKDCDKKEEGTAKAAFCAFVCEKQDSDWIIDSGASRHMTPDERMLSDLRSSDIGEITIADSAKMRVTKSGRAILQLDEKQIDVNNVLHVPRLAANLLSVSQIVKQKNSVTFDENGCTIRNKANEIVARCTENNGLYKFKNASGMCMLSKQNTNAFTWHRRLGHVNFQSLKKMRDGAVEGVDFKDDDSEIRRCEICAMGKQSRFPFKASVNKSKEILELIHSDLMGPMETQSIGHARYILTFIDDFSKKVFTYFLKSKSEVYDRFIEFKAVIEKKTNLKIKTIRTDNGTEYCTKEFDDFCKKEGIQHQLTTVYTPQQNGVAERMNRTLVEKAKCLLFDADMSRRFWAEAINMATFLTNRTVCSSHDKTPEEVFFGAKVDVSGLKIFGSTAMVQVPKQKRRKWDKNSEKLVFVGYDNNTKGYRCINRETGKLTISRDVIFIENVSDDKIIIIEADANDSVRDHEGSAIEELENPKEVANEDDSSMQITEDESSFESIVDESGVSLDDPNITVYEPTENQRNQEPRSPIITRNISKGNPRPLNFLYFVSIEDPKNVNEMKERKDASQWKLAMDDEMQSHRINGTWTLVDLPNGRKPIKAKWVFKTKKNEDGNIVRHKARLVAKGCSQKYGIDYGETFSPVVRYNSIRFLIAYAVKARLKIHHMDAITAFLQGELDEIIFMEQPEEYEDGTRRVCRLNKAVYGLKQAGRQWNLKLDGALQKFGLKKGKMDPCVYHSGNLELIVAIYVDDFLLFYRDESKLHEIKEFLNKNFSMKDIGLATNCIGMRINQGNEFIEVDQTNYIYEILERFGMKDCKPTGTPSATGEKLTID